MARAAEASIRPSWPPPMIPIVAGGRIGWPTILSTRLSVRALHRAPDCDRDDDGGVTTTSGTTTQPATLESALRQIDRLLLPISVAALAVGIVAVVAGGSEQAFDVWTALTIVVAIRLVVEIVDALRHG